MNDTVRGGRVNSWNVNCGTKRSAIVAGWFIFAVLWHILCLEAWLGFRFVRACALMWRWERQAAAAAAAAECGECAEAAKAEAPRRGDGRAKNDERVVVVVDGARL